MKKLMTVLALLAISVAAFSQSPKVGMIPSDEGLFPFNISYDLAPGVTDFSALLDAPAGKYGFTRIENGHFVNDNGRIRFNGVNIVGGACFPSHEKAERMADRLAHFGFNIARIHFYDLVTYGFRLIREKGLLLDDGTLCNPDPEMFELFDYMLYCLKEKGIYVNINLLVGRPFKGRNSYDPDLQEKELIFARNLLTHRNPYTGLTLATDPGVAVIELNNEDAIFARYKDNRKKEWPDQKKLKTMSTESKQALFDVLEEADRSHWDRQRDFLKNELGVKVPITSTQVNYTSPWALLNMDYFDMHAYWCHPKNSGSVDSWAINNIPMVNDPTGGNLPKLASNRRADRPFTVSEYNHPFPNLYGAEGQPMLRAFAAFQGWDGVIAHSYHNLPDTEPDHLAYNFTYAARTDALAHFPVCATMFLREDVKESGQLTTFNMPRSFFVQQWCEKMNRFNSHNFDKAFNGRMQNLLVHRTAIDFDTTQMPNDSGEEFGPVKMSETGEIEWNNDLEDQGMFIVRTPGSKVFSGFPAGRDIDLGDGIGLKVGETKLGWTTLSMTGNGAAAKAKGKAPAKGLLCKGSSILLVATGYTKQTGQKFTAELDKDGNPTTWIHSRRDDWGEGPMLTEGIPAEITLPLKARQVRCWALDENGARREAVTVRRSGRCSVIAIGPEYKTIWYEIDVK